MNAHVHVHAIAKCHVLLFVIDFLVAAMVAAARTVMDTKAVSSVQLGQGFWHTHADDSFAITGID